MSKVREVFSGKNGSQRDDLPRLAATTVLLRSSKSGSRFEVFFVQRHRASDFMGGAHVFPGGKVDDCDGDEAWEPLVWGDLPATLSRLKPAPGRQQQSGDALGSVIAAARELFEEAGVLLALDAAGAPVQMDAALAAAREDVHENPAEFLALLSSRELRLDLSALAYFAHWVTPSLERRRFDARFFLARLPEGQAATVDESETVSGIWHSPRGALAAVADGEMILPPPTLRTVEWLAKAPTLAAAFAAAARTKIAAILPKVAQTEDGVGVLLPWDRDYEEAEGEALGGLGADHPSRFGGSRIVMQDGRWHSLDR